MYIHVVILQDLYHAQDRLVRHLIRRHPDYAAARAELRDIFREVRNATLRDRKQLIERLQQFWKKFRKPLAHHALTDIEKIRKAGENASRFIRPIIGAGDSKRAPIPHDNDYNDDDDEDDDAKHYEDEFELKEDGDEDIAYDYDKEHSMTASERKRACENDLVQDDDDDPRALVRIIPTEDDDLSVDEISDGDAEKNEGYLVEEYDYSSSEEHDNDNGDGDDHDDSNKKKTKKPKHKLKYGTLRSSGKLAIQNLCHATVADGILNTCKFAEHGYVLSCSAPFSSVLI